MKSWTELDVFLGLDLEESFVLGWNSTNDHVRFEIEFSLLPEHPAFELPPPEHWACFRRGSLIFEAVISVDGLPQMEAVMPAVDANNEKDYGHLDTFVEIKQGNFKLVGDLGVVQIQARSIAVTIYEVEP